MNSVKKIFLYSVSLGQFVEKVGVEDGKRKVSFIVDWQNHPMEFTWFSALYYKFWIKLYFGETVIRKSVLIYGDNPATLDDLG